MKWIFSFSEVELTTGCFVTGVRILFIPFFTQHLHSLTCELIKAEPLSHQLSRLGEKWTNERVVEDVITLSSFNNNNIHAVNKV